MRGKEEGQSSHQLLVEGACALLKPRCRARARFISLLTIADRLHHLVTAFSDHYRSGTTGTRLENQTPAVRGRLHRLYLF